MKKLIRPKEGVKVEQEKEQPEIKIYFSGRSGRMKWGRKKHETWINQSPSRRAQATITIPKILFTTPI